MAPKFGVLAKEEGCQLEVAQPFSFEKSLFLEHSFKSRFRSETVYLVGAILLSEVFTNFCKIYADKIKQISRKNFETYERIKQFIIEHKFSEEDLRIYVKCEAHLELSSRRYGTY